MQLLVVPRYIAFSATVSFLAAGLMPARAQAPDFADLSLEQLAHYEVTTLGRKNATLFDTPAPSDVISGEEIRNSGALTLPDALRLAPGVQVARIDSTNYAISARGFNDATSSKLLVLLDGRSMYNQLSSGTNWSLMDLVLDDVSRIEVQRGPAGTLWGANAVNGVINIVSKNAHSTLGSLVSLAVGDEMKFASSIRQGISLSPSTAARAYAKFQSHDDYGSDSPYGVKSWNSRLAGARLDWDRPGGGGLAIIGEYRELRTDRYSQLPTLLPPYFTAPLEQRRDRNGDLSAHWNQPITADGQLSVLAAVSRGDSQQIASDERHTTSDLDTQLTLHPTARHEVILGATYRSTSDNIRNTPWLTYDEPKARTDFYGAFIQDEFSVIPDVFSLTAGTKLERNTFTGWEVQPSLRALVHPTRRQSVWAAVSRAARTPSRAERGVHFFAGAIPPNDVYPLPIALVANGDTQFESEHVLSYEMGHRYELGNTFSVQTSVFYSRYNDLRGLSPILLPFDPTLFPPHFVADLNAGNSLKGHTYGGEISLRWRFKPALELAASVASVRTKVSELSPGLLADPSVMGLQGNTPHEEYKLHATWRPQTNWIVDAVARHTGALTQSHVEAYDGLDLRLGWQIRPLWTIDLVGRDLLEPRHTEIGSSFISTGAQTIARSFFVSVTFRH